MYEPPENAVILLQTQQIFEVLCYAAVGCPSADAMVFCNIFVCFI